jgi:hypothetical protein
VIAAFTNLIAVEDPAGANMRPEIVIDTEPDDGALEELMLDRIA